MSLKAGSSPEAPDKRSVQPPPGLQPRETPGRGPHGAHMTSDPQKQEIINKCVMFEATKFVVICYTPIERSLKTVLQ